MTFEAELESLRPKMQAFCRSKVGSQLADDLVQDTYVRAWAARASYRREDPMLNWLCKISARLHLDLKRYEGRRVKCVSVEDANMEFLHLYDVVADPINEIEEWIEERNAEAVKRDLFADATRPTRTAMSMLLDGLNYAEISDKLGVPIGTVRSRIHRCRERLGLAQGRAA